MFVYGTSRSVLMSTGSFMTRAASATLILILAACGGGGGDSATGVSVPTGVRSGTATAGSDLSAANGATFAGPLARVFLGAADGDTPGVSGGRESPQSVKADNGGAGTVSRGVVGFAAVTAARAIAVTTTGRELVQAISTQPLPCPYGGSGSVSVNDADNNNKLSRGDSATLTFNACVVELGLPATNGSLSFTVNAVELDANNEPTALDATLTLSGFVEAGLGSMSGSFRIWFKNESPTSARQRVSYQAVTVTEAGQTLRYDFDQYGVDGTSGGSFDLNGAVVIGGQTYTLTSDVFGYTAGQLPTSGTLRLRDAAGDALILRVRSATTFDLEFQANGATAPTVISVNLAWSSYRLGN
jgi:hypothetical protein